MTVDKILKAALVTIGAGSAAVATNDFFAPVARAYATVTGAAAGALLAYLLKPQSEPQDVKIVNPPSDPANVQETA